MIALYLGVYFRATLYVGAISTHPVVYLCASAGQLA